MNEVFNVVNVAVEAYWNIITATSFSYRLATQGLRQSERDYNDPAYEVIIAVRTLKSEST